MKRKKENGRVIPRKKHSPFISSQNHCYLLLELHRTSSHLTMVQLSHPIPYRQWVFYITFSLNYEWFSPISYVSLSNLTYTHRHSIDVFLLNSPVTDILPNSTLCKPHFVLLPVFSTVTSSFLLVILSFMDCIPLDSMTLARFSCFYSCISVCISVSFAGSFVPS